MPTLTVGAPVRIHSLEQPQSALNGRRGIVVGERDPITGRRAVQVDDPSPEDPRASRSMAQPVPRLRKGCRTPIPDGMPPTDGHRTIIQQLLPKNMIDLADVAMRAVFSDLDLLREISTFIERWVRAGILTGVSSAWRSCIWAHADLYRSVVVLSADATQPISPHSNLWDNDKQYNGKSFMLEGALPVLTSSQAAPVHTLTDANAAWVEELFVEWNRPEALSTVLKLTFPRLTKLMLCGQFISNEEVVQWRAWLELHLAQAPLKHLYMDEQLGGGAVDFLLSYEEIMAAQPGLESVRLFYFKHLGTQPPLDLIRGWSSGVRSALTALALVDVVAIADVRAIIELLPNLRRFSWAAEVGWPNYNGELNIALSRVIEESNIEALYVHLCEFHLPTWAFDRFCSGSKLKELVVRFIDGQFHHLYPDEPFGEAYDHGPATISDAMYFLKRSLPQATLLIEDATWDDRTGEEFADPLHRVFLPATQEQWHLATGTQGPSL